MKMFHILAGCCMSSAPLIGLGNEGCDFDCHPSLGVQRLTFVRGGSNSDEGDAASTNNSEAVS